ncbi:MAG: hypothetical protein QM710_09770 [Flavobacterium sp.]
MSNKEKHKPKKKKEKALLKIQNMAEKCKSSCCEKYKKKESKRCKRCPMFDLLKKYKDSI